MEQDVGSPWPVDATLGEGVPVDEVVVVRLEGLGTFAVPVAALDGYRLAVGPRVLLPDDEAAPAAPVLEALPIILAQDFLRTAGASCGALVVDDLGCVRRTGP